MFEKIKSFFRFFIKPEVVVVKKVVEVEKKVFVKDLGPIYQAPTRPWVPEGGVFENPYEPEAPQLGEVFETGWVWAQPGKPQMDVVFLGEGSTGFYWVANPETLEKFKVDVSELHPLSIRKKLAPLPQKNIDVRTEDVGRHSPWAFNANRFPPVPSEGYPIHVKWVWMRSEGELVDCFPIVHGPEGSGMIWIYVPEQKKNLFVSEKQVSFLTIYHYKPESH